MIFKFFGLSPSLFILGFILSFKIDFVPLTQAFELTSNPSWTSQPTDLAPLTKSLNSTPTTPSPYVYTPLDPLFWKKLQNLIKTRSFEEVVVQGSTQEQKHKGHPLSDEGRLAIGLGLKFLGYNFAAYTLLRDLALEAVGTRVAEAALFEISQLSLKEPAFFNEDENFINQTDFGPVSAAIESYLAAHRYLHNLKYGYTRWALEQEKLIEISSPWYFYIQYQKALDKVVHQKNDQAEALLKELYVNPLTPLLLQNQSALQLARLNFEKGNFEDAAELYNKVEELGLREKGRLLLEKAWTEYYRKDYGKSLGLLEALRSSYFLPSLTPERFILENIIYRDLCRYQDVQRTVKMFNETFRTTLDAIEKRKPLRENLILLNMALLDTQLQHSANFIDTLRQEVTKFRMMKSWRRLSFFEPVLSAYRLQDQKLQRQLDLVLEPRARQQAESLLEIYEQIQFISYVSKIDEQRLSQDPRSTYYKAPLGPDLSFAQLSWPVDSFLDHEYWWDELPDYKVLISNHCHQVQSQDEWRREKKFR